MNCTKEDMLLYAVTDRAWTGEKTLMEQVKEALDGGITFLQLREKELGEEEFLREAKDMKALAAAYHIPFIINDNVELALAIGADGVHVGQDDMEAGKVREKLGPDKIIGVSAHSVEEAVEAEKNGADYLGAGAVFSTSPSQIALSEYAQCHGQYHGDAEDDHDHCGNDLSGLFAVHVKHLFLLRTLGPFFLFP